ncbi:MAG: hypothetical protein V2A54_07665 [Bacteroidota bacterium]
MKTLKVLFAIVSFFCLTSLTAATVPSPSTEIMHKVITSNLTYPEQAREQFLEGGAGILFTVSAEGKIIIKGISASDEIFECSVRAQLENLIVPISDVNPNEEYLIRISFRLE